MVMGAFADCSTWTGIRNRPSLLTVVNLKLTELLG